MPYSTQTDIESAIGAERVTQLADDNDDGVADAAVVAAAIDWADRLIDSYAAGKYEIPFAPSTPAEIADRSAELAAYWLHRRRQNRDESAQKMHDDALAWLRDLQSGKVNVVANLATAQVGVGVGSVKVSAKDAVITDDKLEGY